MMMEVCDGSNCLVISDAVFNLGNLSTGNRFACSNKKLLVF